MGYVICCICGELESDEGHLKKHGAIPFQQSSKKGMRRGGPILWIGTDVPHLDYFLYLSHSLTLCYTLNMIGMLLPQDLFTGCFLNLKFFISKLASTLSPYSKVIVSMKLTLTILFLNATCILPQNFLVSPHST